MGKKITYNEINMAHYNNGYVLMPDEFNLVAEYERPKSYLAMICRSNADTHGTGQRVRVWVDHDATGTEGAGTGDTVVRSRRQNV